jgi:hypothetical protein
MFKEVSISLILELTLRAKMSVFKKTFFGTFLIQIIAQKNSQVLLLKICNFP